MPEFPGLDRFIQHAEIPELEKVTGGARYQRIAFLTLGRMSPEDILARIRELEKLYDRNVEKVLDYLKQEQFSLSAALDLAIRGLNERTRTTSFAFYQDDVPASQTNVQLAGFMSPRGWCAPEAGSIVGVTVTLNDARTAGTLTIEPTITDKDTGVVTATGLTVVIDGTNTRSNFSAQDAGTDVFDGGDMIGLRITTDSSWLPTADLDASVWVINEGRTR